MERVPVSWSFTKRKRVKSREEEKKNNTHLRNGSTCLVLVNKDHTLDVAEERRYKPQHLFTPLQENSPAVQLSKSENYTPASHVTKLRRH